MIRFGAAMRLGHSPFYIAASVPLARNLARREDHFTIGGFFGGLFVMWVAFNICKALLQGGASP